MPTKCTAFFEVAPEYKDGNVYRIAGFSESYYHPAGFANGSAQKEFSTLMQLRAKMLPKQGSIVAYRFQDIPTADGRPGRSKVTLNFIRGNTTYDTDVPNLCYAARAYAADPAVNRRILELRAFPDVLCVKGEASLDAPWQKAYNDYTKQLIGTWMFRGNILSGSTAHIQSVDNAGNVQTDDDFVSGGAGKKVTIVRCKKAGTNDDFFGGTWKVGAQAGARTLTLANYGGQAGTGGTIRVWGHDFFTFGAIDSEAVFVRKVGRPFYQYRGKASKRA